MDAAPPGAAASLPTARLALLSRRSFEDSLRFGSRFIVVGLRALNLSGAAAGILTPPDTQNKIGTNVGRVHYGRLAEVLN